MFDIWRSKAEKIVCQFVFVKKMWTISYCSVLLLLVVVNGCELVQNAMDNVGHINEFVVQLDFQKKDGKT